MIPSLWSSRCRGRFTETPSQHSPKSIRPATGAVTPWLVSEVFLEVSFNNSMEVIPEAASSQPASHGGNW